MHQDMMYATEVKQTGQAERQAECCEQSVVLAHRVLVAMRMRADKHNADENGMLC